MLRNLIKGLLLANVLLFAWGRWIVAPEVANPLAFGDVTGPQLVLIEGVRRTASRTASGSMQDGARCFRLGPFASADAAMEVSNRLAARGLAVNRARESGRIWVGHWVQLLDLPSLEAANHAVSVLVGGGISDAYISAREPTVDISLGVFRSRAGADDVLRVARNLGYAAVALDRFREGIEYWVEIATPSDQPPDLADLRRGEAQIIRVEERSCQPAAPIALAEDSLAEDGDGADDSLESPARENGSPGPTTLPE